MDLEFRIYPDPLLVADAMDAAADEIDVSPGPMGDSLGILMASIERAFIEQGPGWEPWSESYAASMGRRSHGPLPGQDSILIREAELIGSTQDPANYEVERNSISWTGHAAPGYAELHLTGTEKMPERNFLRIDEVAQEEILAVWTHWMGDIIRPLGSF